MMGTASARSVRPPSDIRIAPQSWAAATSGTVQPPSGPTIRSAANFLGTDCTGTTSPSAADGSTLADDRLDAGHAQHHRIADDVIQLVALEHADDKRQGDLEFGSRLDLLDQPYGGGLLADLHDFRAPERALAVEDVHFVTGTQPQHARQVLSLILRHLDERGRRIYARHMEARTHAESILICTDVL